MKFHVFAGHIIKQHQTEMAGPHTRYRFLYYSWKRLRSVRVQSLLRPAIWRFFFKKNNSVNEVACACGSQYKTAQNQHGGISY